MLAEFERRIEELLDRAPDDSNTLDVPLMAVIGALRHVISRHLRTHAEDRLPSLLEDGLRWLSSYSVPGGAERWSTSPAALLKLTAEPSPCGVDSRAAAPRQHGLPASVIARSQRTRLIHATAEVSMAKGWANTKIADIVAAARVARPVFYEHFTDKEDAFLEAQQHPTQYILDRCAEAYFSGDAWPQRMWRCLQTLLSLIAENPAISQLRLVECYAAGPKAIRNAEEITRSFTIFLEEGYHYRAQAASTTPPMLPGGHRSNLRDHPARRSRRPTRTTHGAPTPAHLHSARPIHRRARGNQAGRGDERAGAAVGPSTPSPPLSRMRPIPRSLSSRSSRSLGHRSTPSTPQL